MTALALDNNRLFVATINNTVKIYDIVEQQHPYLVGRFKTAGKVESITVHGSNLHIAEHQDGVFQRCLSGNHCPPGTDVEVFDVSESTDVYKIGEYDGMEHPAVHMKMVHNFGLLRTFDGFKVYRFDPVP